jgi:hypothetical protein
MTTPIRVEFIDVTTQQTFLSAEVPMEQLPETFALNTVIHLGEQDWQVIAAEPLTRAEYVQQGALKLTLQRVFQMPLQNILYSLPTIYDPIPTPILPAVAPANPLKLHDDQWRRIEFVGAAESATIETELKAIAKIHEEHLVGEGFDKLHLRQAPQVPLAGNFTRQDLVNLFVGATPYDALMYEDGTGILADGFALRYGRLALYGIETDGAVQVLGIAPLNEGVALSLDPLVTFMQRYQVYLVDWCSVLAFTAAEVIPYCEEMGWV